MAMPCRDAESKAEKPGGQPVEYRQEAKERSKALRAENVSIRKIAAEMEANTFTVQKLLKS